VDDDSRLGRDLTDRLNLQRELHRSGVTIVNCSVGITSTDKHAKTFTVIESLKNDLYISDLADKTHRGLTGRALSGHWTGGLVYGYRTQPEPNPPDPKHVRAVVVIDPA
jgi:DNA invertase Pin-like site-specific DNA recombinase